ncbi:hypothetical protein Moror_13849 [Moniliophthora roreri MCA 2997]|uniref:Hepatocellular carcinoma-associated antigen 59-domain-containing protein n=1 Tax=Moniliophthora roreri (strain MCA 2997) TaxID=1381753 RepID=V2XN21_MONRO|nr:hypothetical protein Moror_13849 [Moniliophthora roreri MCA 2997]
MSASPSPAPEASSAAPIIKKRSRPQPRVREQTPEVEETPEALDEEKLPITDLIELRKLRKSRQGIDSTKLSQGDKKKKRKKAEVDNEEEQEDEQQLKSRRAVRANNFTQQTNALDVDKHMMVYIEENLKIRSRPKDDSEKKNKPLDPQEALYQVPERWKVEQKKQETDDGSITNSMTMLTAIPEVDLGMDARLKNIEETEKAKRVVAEDRSDKRTVPKGEEHLVAARFYRPNLKMKSDADIMRDAKLEAMGLQPQDEQPRRTNQDKPQMATDELVMERFKKRMRK